jgi:membrane protease YdiL (CAAX protease family)
MDKATTDGAGGAKPSRRRVAWELAAYVALVFALTWGISLALAAFPKQVQAVTGPLGKLTTSWPFYVAVWAPTLSALVLSLAFGGLAGLRALAARALRPAPIGWIGVALFGIPAALLVFSLAERVLAPGGQHFIDLHALAIGMPVLLFTSAVVADSGGLGEEPGWRGFALPRLLQLMGPLPAGITLGVVWGVWHLPAFLAQGALGQSSFGLFLVAITAMSVCMTWIYVHANGNFLIAGFIPHIIANLMGDAHVLARDPDLIEAVVFLALAAIIILTYGPSLQRWRRKPAGPS